MWEKYIHKQATLFYSVGIKIRHGPLDKRENKKCQLTDTQAARQIIVLKQKHSTKTKLHRQGKENFAVLTIAFRCHTCVNVPYYLNYLDKPE